MSDNIADCDGNQVAFVGTACVAVRRDFHPSLHYYWFRILLAVESVQDRQR